jgi:hypothetical protein
MSSRIILTPWDGVDLYPSVEEKAATLVTGVIVIL